MALPSSGSAISFSQINTEIGRSATAALSMDDATLRLVFGVSSGEISMSVMEYFTRLEFLLVVAWDLGFW